MLSPLVLAKDETVSEETEVDLKWKTTETYFKSEVYRVQILNAYILVLESNVNVLHRFDKNHHLPKSQDRLTLLKAIVKMN